MHKKQMRHALLKAMVIKNNIRLTGKHDRTR